MRFLGAYRYHRLYEISAELREIGAENGNHFVRNYVVVFEPQMDTAEQKTFAKEWGVFENVSAARRAIDAKCEEMRQRNLTQIENAAHIAAEEKRKMCALRAGEKTKMVRSGSDPPLRKNVADLRSAFSKMILFFRIIFRAQPDPKNHATLCGAWDSQNCTFHEKVRFSFKTVFAVLNRK